MPLNSYQINRDFYSRHPLITAPDLIGKILTRIYKNQKISGRIVEVEAYLGMKDPASHAFHGQTKRNASLYKSPGTAYVHTIHQQKCLDIVVEDINTPSSVLIRALEPMTGIKYMKSNRNQTNLMSLTSGPGKLTQALKIDLQYDGYDLTQPSSQLYIEEDGYIPEKIEFGPRIGISKAKELEYRFYIPNNPYLSKTTSSKLD
jgi:DNA-3-methyladenine glycosylase